MHLELPISISFFTSKSVITFLLYVLKYILWLLSSIQLDLGLYTLEFFINTTQEYPGT